MQQPCILIYDIPKSLGQKFANNVVHTLRSRAAHIQGSGWVIFESEIPVGFVEDMIEAGCMCEVVPFDMKACEKLMRMAATAIRTDIRQTVKNHKESVENYVNQMVTSRTPPVQAYVECRKKVAPVLQKMARKLKQFKQAATTFGVESEVGTFSAFAALDNLRNAMLERTATYLQAAAQLEGKNPGDLMARAIRQGMKVPAFILADYADEADIPVAPKIRNLF
jgi:hypothetical protein